MIIKNIFQKYYVKILMARVKLYFLISSLTNIITQEN